MLTICSFFKENLVGAQHYRHHSRISPQSSKGNATPKPHNAATIYRRKQRERIITASIYAYRRDRQTVMRSPNGNAIA
ncbi:hypothetical protein [Pseudanabaena yagii]|uniref:Uncharacterized protein n=1 Tax=Pseudanabaena yagii GIHE-NHR1 TaxID=2722753 RepID=A0ABX1LVP4_9CYAN|nr:hypothetical protein [Pseudanabaena yagii]NMF59541.1 hypothetical protein [Pseudanabaena yagii GIHE-NHR1]